ncbi:MAG: YceI family protein [Tepidiformaceae bacterium]
MPFLFLIRFFLGGLIGRVITLAVLVAIVAGAGWWFFISDDASLATNAPDIPASVKEGNTPAPTALPSSSGTPAADPTNAPVPAGVTVYNIIAGQSQAAYFAGEKLASLPLPSTAEGKTSDISGHFALTANGLDTTNTSAFTVNLKSLKSDKDMRDGRVQQALQTSTFATTTFTATKLSGWPATFPDATEVDMQLTGTMDLHGVKKEVTWAVKAKKEGAGFSLLATVTFPYSEFNINKPNIAGFVTVDDSVTLQVQLVAQAA